MKKIKFEICHDKWLFSILSDDSYVKKHGKTSIAMTMPDEHIVDFKESEFDLKTVLHELVHAHSTYMYLDSAKIHQDSMEEIYSEFISDRSSLLNKQAKIIYKKLKK